MSSTLAQAMTSPNGRSCKGHRVRWGERSPEPRYLAAIVGLGATTGAAGLLGTCTGVMNTLRFAVTVPKEEQFTVVALGCKESLHVMMLGLILLVVAGLFASIGAVRAMGLVRSTAA
jgi:hypothetical protein